MNIVLEGQLNHSLPSSKFSYMTYDASSCDSVSAYSVDFVEVAWSDYFPIVKKIKVPDESSCQNSLGYDYKNLGSVIRPKWVEDNLLAYSP